MVGAQSEASPAVYRAWAEGPSTPTTVWIPQGGPGHQRPLCTGADVRNQLHDWTGEKPERRNVNYALKRLEEVGLLEADRGARSHNWRFTDRGRAWVRRMALPTVEQRIVTYDEDA